MLDLTSASLKQQARDRPARDRPARDRPARPSVASSSAAVSFSTPARRDRERLTGGRVSDTFSTRVAMDVPRSVPRVAT